MDTVSEILTLVPDWLLSAPAMASSFILLRVASTAASLLRYSSSGANWISSCRRT